MGEKGNGEATVGGIVTGMGPAIATEGSHVTARGQSTRTGRIMFDREEFDPTGSGYRYRQDANDPNVYTDTFNDDTHTYDPATDTTTITNQDGEVAGTQKGLPGTWGSGSVDK